MKRLLWFALGVIAGWVGNVAREYFRSLRETVTKEELAAVWGFIEMLKLDIDLLEKKLGLDDARPTRVGGGIEFTGGSCASKIEFYDTYNNDGLRAVDDKIL